MNEMKRERDRDNSWKSFNELVDQVGRKYGGSVRDTRCGKTWDPGQAVCAAAYGPDWSNDPRFHAANESDAFCPPEAFAAAKELLDGECEWAESEE